MVGWIMGGGFSVSESRQLIQSIVVSKTTFGVATSGVTPERLVRSDRSLGGGEPSDWDRYLMHASDRIWEASLWRGGGLPFDSRDSVCRWS